MEENTLTDTARMEEALKKPIVRTRTFLSVSLSKDNVAWVRRNTDKSKRSAFMDYIITEFRNKFEELVVSELFNEVWNKEQEARMELYKKEHEQELQQQFNTNIKPDIDEELDTILQEQEENYKDKKLEEHRDKFEAFKTEYKNKINDVIKQQELIIKREQEEYKQNKLTELNMKLEEYKKQLDADFQQQAETTIQKFNEDKKTNLESILDQEAQKFITTGIRKEERVFCKDCNKEVSDNRHQYIIFYKDKKGPFDKGTEYHHTLKRRLIYTEI